MNTSLSQSQSAPFSESILKIAPALLKAQKEMGNATKGASNPFFKSRYADLNSVREAVTPALHNNGITILQLNVTVDHIPHVRTVLLHESGEFISSDTQIVSKDATNPQAHGSAISYARRYGLQSMLSIGSEDDDGEAATGRNSYTKSNGKTQTVVSGSAIAQAEGLKQSFGSFRKGNS